MKFFLRIHIKMFDRRIFIHFSLLLVVANHLFLLVDAASESIAVPGNPIAEAELIGGIATHMLEYGNFIGFGDKDTDHAIRSAEYAVKKLAESIGLPIETEKFESIKHAEVLEMLKERLVKEEKTPEVGVRILAKIPGIHDTGEVLKKLDNLEMAKLNLIKKYEDGMKEMGKKFNDKEDLIKSLLKEVEDIREKVKEIENIIKNVLELAKANPLNASAAAEFYVKKLGFKIRANFSKDEDEYMLRKVNELDGTVVTKIYKNDTEKDIEKFVKFQTITEKVTYAQIYNKVLTKLNGKKEKELQMWDQNRFFKKQYTMPIKHVKAVLAEMNEKKINLDKENGKEKAKKVKELNEAIKKLAKIANETMA